LKAQWFLARRFDGHPIQMCAPKIDGVRAHIELRAVTAITVYNWAVVTTSWAISITVVMGCN